MSLHDKILDSDDQLNPRGPKPEEIDTSKGYEQTDIRVTGIVVFLAALAIFVAVAGVLCYGVGKVMNAHLLKEDGPTNKWSKTVNVRDLGNLPTNPDLQRKMADITQQFPEPRVQTDDGNQDVADLHAREDLLLEQYTWADQGQGKVRIPVERAMELIAQRGLAVAPKVDHAPLMAGDHEPEVTAPLTNGFARTAYELDQKAAEAFATQRGEERK